MERVNLARDDGSFRPFAFVEVLAVMCFPFQKAMREKCSTYLINEPDEPFPTWISAAMQRGSLAGEVYTTLLQLREAEQRPSINNVLKILQASPEPVERRSWPLTGPAWREWSDNPKLRVHRQTVQTCFREFEPVRHLWAASTLYIALFLADDETVFWPRCNADLGEFLAGAERLSEMGTNFVLQGAQGQRTRRYLFQSKNACHFVIPSEFRCRVDVTLPQMSQSASIALRIERPTR